MSGRFFFVGLVVVTATLVLGACGPPTGIDLLSAHLRDTDNWRLFQTYNRGLDDITTFTANGLVSEHLDHVYLDGAWLAAGSLEAGFSYISVTDVTDPSGKVFSYTGPDSADESDRFGFSGFAKRGTDETLYAWYGHSIVGVPDKVIVSDLAPDYTNRYRGCSPNSRFVFDDAGRAWIGASDLNDDGTLATNETDDENGLFRISSDFSSREKLVDDAIWSLYRDSGGDIWVSARDAIWKSTAGANPVSILLPAGLYVERFVEFEDAIYAVMKDFFHNPYASGVAQDFDLYRWNETETETQFDFVADITEGGHEMPAFVWGGELYLHSNGRTWTLNSDQTNVVEADAPGEPFGAYDASVYGNSVASTGNIAGVALHNHGGSGQTINLTPANTAEALIVDDVLEIFGRPNGDIYVGVGASGFNVYSDGVFATRALPGEVHVVGFFEHDGVPYAAGAVNVYDVGGTSPSVFASFSTNGEEVSYDGAGYLWAFPNFGSGAGVIGMLSLADNTIVGTKESDGSDYWQTVATWELDAGYHYNDVCPEPGSSRVHIAVSDGENIGAPLNHTLVYDHTTDSFSQVPMPDDQSEGMRLLGHKDGVMYGVARQKLYRLDGQSWAYLMDIQLGNDFEELTVFGDFALIASGWNSSGDGARGGFEIVDLANLTSQHYTSADVPLPSDSVFAVETQELGNSVYRLWFGTFQGLGYCDLDLSFTEVGSNN